MRYLSIKNQLKLMVNKFAYKGFNFNSKVQIIKSKAKDLQSPIAIQIYNHHQKLQFKQIQSGVTPKIIAQQICDLFQYITQQFQIEINQFGVIQFSYKNEFLERLMNQIIQHQMFNYQFSKAYLKNNIQLKQAQVGIIFPSSDILQAFTLNYFRKWNYLQSLARINQMLNNKVRRIQCISNNTVFHGIILSFLLQKHQNTKFSMNEIAIYLKSQNLTTQQNITNYGTLTLSQISLDQKLGKLNEELYRTYCSKLYSLFQPKKSFELVNSQQLRVRNKQDILKKLVRTNLKQSQKNYIGCQLYESIQYQSLNKKQNLNLQIVEIGQIKNNQEIIEYLSEINRMIKQRIKNNLPQLDAQIQTGLQNRWSKYYLNTYNRKSNINVSKQDVINIIFTKGQQRKDYYFKQQKLNREGFKIRNNFDRQIAVIILQIGHLYESQDLFGVYQNILKLQQLLNKSFNYPNVALIRIMLQKFYSIIGVI